jgi:hypothetical protein
VIREIPFLNLLNLERLESGTSPKTSEKAWTSLKGKVVKVGILEPVSKPEVRKKPIEKKRLNKSRLLMND